MKKYFVKKCCMTFVLALCIGGFAYAQQKNPEGVRMAHSKVNVEFTDMSFVKGLEAPVTHTAKKADFHSGVRGTGTFNIATGSGTGEGWSWNAPILTILDASNVTITGQVDPSTNNNRIIIAAGATTHVILSDISLIMELHEGEPFLHPLFLEQGATLNLTLEGENIIKAGHYVPGISVAEGRTIIIDGNGSLSSTGGWQCSGIGGGLWDWGPCGTIIINGGTIYAKGDNSSWIGAAGAGIGSGAAYANGNITINGGSITALPGNESAKGIGNGGTNEIGTLTMTGNPIIFTTGVSDMSLDNKTGGILVTRNVTHWYGNNNYTLEYNTTVPFSNLMTIGEGKSITIPAGMTMINNGTIVNYSNITINGTLINSGVIFNVNAGTITGTVTGDPPIAYTPVDNNIDLSNASPSPVGNGWVYANNVFAILDGADVNITGTGSSQRRVEVANHAVADITLNNASIASVGNYQTPLMINTGSEVNLTIEGVNTMTAKTSKSGIQVPEGAALTIDGSGSLNATGGEYGGAGIGGAFCENSGAITINGGAISATSVYSGSYHDGAGIGGGGAGIVFFFYEGMGGHGGDVTINGGIVKASTVEGSGAAGIGGGSASTYGGTLTMEANGVAFASTLETYNGTQTDVSGVVNGILFNSFNGLLYGTVTIADDLEIPLSYTLVIPEGTTLTIPKERTLTVKGTVINNGTIIKCGTIIGTIQNNQPVDCDPPPPEKYTITFYVFDAKTELPVPDAIITFNGEELESYEVEVEEGNYEYTVFHPDYETYSDTLYVNESMTINIPLTGKEGITDISIDGVVLYPNPFTNEIHIGNPSAVRSVVITTATGQNVETVTFDGKTISTKGLASGIYFVILENLNGEKTVHKMIKK